MITPLDFLQDLFNPHLAFLPRALLALLLSTLVTGIIGCHVVMRGMVFIGDAVSHSVFPGIAIAFLLGHNLLLGGLLAGVITAILVAVLSQNQKLHEDSVIGILFAGAFALGIVVISLSPNYTGSLQDFLFGSIVGINTHDLQVMGLATLVILGILLLFHRHIVTVSLDKESARAAGLPVVLLDVLLYVLVTVSVVISLQTLGNILVLALIVIPPTTARLLCKKLSTMLVVSPIFGMVTATLGLYLSWAFNLPVGGTIVLVMIASFMLTWGATKLRH